VGVWWYDLRFAGTAWADLANFANMSLISTDRGAELDDREAHHGKGQPLACPSVSILIGAGCSLPHYRTDTISNFIVWICNLRSWAVLIP